MSGDAKVKVEVDADSELSFNLENAVSRLLLEPKKEKNVNSEFMCIRDTINSKLVPYVRIAENRSELVKWFQNLIQMEVQNQTSVLLADKAEAEATLDTRDTYYESRVIEYRAIIKEREIVTRHLRINEIRLERELQFQTETALDFKEKFHSMKDEFLKERQFGESVIKSFQPTMDYMRQQVNMSRKRESNLRDTISKLVMERDERDYQDNIWKYEQCVLSYLYPPPPSNADNESAVNKSKNNELETPGAGNCSPRNELVNSSCSCEQHKSSTLPSVRVPEEEKLPSAKTGSTTFSEDNNTDEMEKLENPSVWSDLMISSVAVLSTVLVGYLLTLMVG